MDKRNQNLIDLFPEGVCSENSYVFSWDLVETKTPITLF